MEATQGACGAAGRFYAALLGTVSAALAFCAGNAVSRTYPFGPHTRNINDLGNQFVPFHAHLWDLLHGRADGGLLLNWQSGYGTSFLPDLGTYVSSPFALLVGLFPRDRIDLAVYVITVMKIGAAAAAMACLLLTLRPGRWWAAGLLGASYAMCGWTLTTASYNTMWLDGLIAFPLFCMVAEWARTGRRPVLSVLVVALGWTANFYTAYMATIASAVVLLGLLLMDPGTTRRQSLTAIGRASLSTVLGIGLTAPLLLTIVKGTRLAHPGTTGDFSAAPWADVFGRLLPDTFGAAAPAVYLNSAALLLALVLPFHGGVPRRTRAVWTGAVLAVALSFQWQPTHLAWHAFANPNGSPYRQTFVLSGVMIIAAWFTLAHGLPTLRQMAWGAAVMGALALAAASGADAGVTGRGTYRLFGIGLALVTGALLLLRRAEAVRNRALVLVAVTALVGVQVGQSALSNAWSDHERVGLLDDYGTWGDRETSQAAAIAFANAWPDYRTDPGREETVGNDPLLVGGQGAAYYSSLTPEIWTRTVDALGGGWTSHGRSLQSLDNPVTDVIFSVGARSHQPPDPHQRGNSPTTAPSTVTRQHVPPLVTVHGPAAGTYGASPYRNQELLLGHQVYDTPGPITLRNGYGKPVQPRGSRFHVHGGLTLSSNDTYTLDVTCPAGDKVYLSTPGMHSRIAAPGGPVTLFTGDMPSRRAAVQHVTDAPAGGHVTLKMRVFRTGTFGTDAIGCLNTNRLAAAEQRITATAATSERVSDDGISAQLPRGSRGLAVVAAPAIAGWQCSAGSGGTRAGRSRLGLLAVQLPTDGSATFVSCSFTPPGLRMGEAVGGLSLLGLAVLAGYGWWRRRTDPAGPPVGGDSEPGVPAGAGDRGARGEARGAGLTLRRSAARG